MNSKDKGRKTITFRFDLPKNNQRIGINLIKDYLLDNIFGEIPKWL